MKSGFYQCDELKELHDSKAVLERAVRLFPDKIAFREIESRNSEREITYRDLYADVKALGTALMRLGMEGKHIALLGENSIDWITALLAVSGGVGAAVPIDRELPPETIAGQLQQSDTEMLFVSAKSLKKLSKIAACTETMPQVVVMRSGLLSDSTQLEDRLTLEQLKQEGREAMASDSCFTGKISDPEKFCLLVYTSGTTGANKGVMLCQRNIWADCYGVRQLLYGEKTSMSVLPVNHTLALSVDIFFSLYEGYTVYINDDLKHVLQNLTRFKPHMVVMVPAMLELIARKIRNEAEKEGLTEKLNRGIRWSRFLLRFGIDIRPRLFAPVHETLGGNLKTIVCGGAPLSEEVNQFVNDIGIEVLNGYGITECSPVLAVNRRRHRVPGSVGRLIPNCEARVADPDENGCGEIQVRGDNVMLGYYHLPEDTSKVFTEDGWFRTGDLGHIDRDSNLFLTGRLKNLIILDNGKNISPEEIEELLQHSMPEIREIVVYAAEEPAGIQAEIYLNPGFCAENGLDTSEKKYDFVMEKVREFNKTEPSYKRISDIVIREREFEKTTTLKIKRASAAAGRRTGEKK